jgi:glycosyltransferase involved in cell wall biosynthesis
MALLTAVIPVATTISNVSNLDHNISMALASNIRVVLIVDQVSAVTNPQLEQISEKYTQGSKAFGIKKGEFRSPGKARNEGFLFVETEFVTFWDADDLVNVEEVTRTLIKCAGDFDYIVGSYEIRNLNSGINLRVLASQPFPRLRVIHQPGVWRIIFRKSEVQNCSYGTSLIGEDQVYLANSGLFNSSRVFFSNLIFYSYFADVNGQLTSLREMNSALRVSILEILRTLSKSDLRVSAYKSLIVVRLMMSLFKRLLTGKR